MNKYCKWTDEQTELLLKYHSTKTLNELSEIIGKDKEKIKTKGWRMNLTFMDYWTESEDKYIKENYINKTYKEIGEVIGRSRSAVQARCRKLGLIKGYDSHKKELNSNYFEVIDTEEKAYWLGFICADGCVSYCKSNGNYIFKIALQKSDDDFLKKFIKAIDGNFDLKYKEINTSIQGRETKKYETCEVSFRDKKFTADLLKYFDCNKTEYLRIPSQVPQDLIRHFIRGFSDGDGCFYCNLDKRDKSYEIVGKCYDMLNDIKNEFAKNDIFSDIFRKRKTNWKLGVYRIKELVKLQSYLYDGATIFMERKYYKSQEILKLAS